LIAGASATGTAGPFVDVAQLLNRPRHGGWSVTPTWTTRLRSMGEEHEYEQQTIRRGRHDEEVRGDDLADVIREESPPRLGRRAPRPLLDSQRYPA
jgi:hypothetical protein